MTPPIPIRPCQPHGAGSTALIAGLLALIACSGGDTSSNEAVGLGLARFVVLDLAHATVQGRQDLDGLDAEARWDSLLVFVRIPDGSSTGSTSNRWALPGEESQALSSERLFIGSHEITRAQWRRLTGHEPWLDLPATLRGTEDDRLPACNLSLDAVREALAAINQHLPGSLRLPTAEEWERSARAGSQSAFSWGDDPHPNIAGVYAVTAETDPGQTGPLPVGSRAANAWGLFDVEGNIRELSAEGLLHAGSWLDNLPLARLAQRSTFPPEMRHALAGLRLVYEPETL